MAHSLLVTTITDGLFPERTMRIKAISVCAPGEAAYIEVFVGATVAGGESIAKVACSAAEGFNAMEQDIDVHGAISVDVGGVGVQAYIVYE